MMTKSKYCLGMQCPKILWMEAHLPEMAGEPTNKSAMVNGTRVGEVAREYFGPYTLVPYDEDKTTMCRSTQDLMDSEAENIAEASFLWQGLYCAVDILHRNGIGWDLVEVKSSTKGKPEYKLDIAYQYYVLQQCGVQVQRALLLVVNNEYIFRGQLDLQQLFRTEDCTAECIRQLDRIPGNIQNLQMIAQQKDEPEFDIGDSCFTPHECRYWAYCARHLPAPSVFDVAGLNLERKAEYYRTGIVSFEDILEKRPKLSAKQLRQVEFSAEHREPYINRKNIREYLQSVSYPVYHLDFETYQLAIPVFEGCAPYCQIPFQYSLHIEQEDSHLEHREFLAKEGTDPRRALAESLCRDIPRGAYCMAYNMAFERGRLKELAEQFPDLEEHLLDIRDNMHDLMVPFQRQDYYAAEMQGS